jgi:peroxiredoxin
MGFVYLINMALTYTPQHSKNKACPDFSLPAVDGKSYQLSDFKDKKALVVMFICNHCPYVVAIEDRYIQLAKEMKDKGVQFIGICSNDPLEYEEDNFKNLKKRWQEKEYGFPYLHDHTQDVAKNFGAVCTPDIFVYKNENKKFNLFYRGRFDDSWKADDKVKNQELKLALKDLLENKKLQKEMVPSMGCSIKWI